MNETVEGQAIVYCEGLFGGPDGKVAHGLVRRSHRYRVLAVIDHTMAGEDAGTSAGVRSVGIPIVGDLETAMAVGQRAGTPATHFVIGIASQVGALTEKTRLAVRSALKAGLNVDSGLRELLSDDPDLLELAWANGCTIRDLRNPPQGMGSRRFEGLIDDVPAIRVAVLGTDASVGKRTTAWGLVDSLSRRGHRAELIGTGETAWFQGVRFGLILDALPHDGVGAELEYAIWNAWNDSRPAVIVIEGQSSLLHPVHPGGYGILAVARPHAVVLQHAPGRTTHRGLPHAIRPLGEHIKAIELVGETSVVAIAINPEDMDRDAFLAARDDIEQQTGLPTLDVLADGADRIAQLLIDEKMSSS